MASRTLRGLVLATAGVSALATSAHASPTLQSTSNPAVGDQACDVASTDGAIECLVAILQGC